MEELDLGFGSLQNADQEASKNTKARAEKVLQDAFSPAAGNKDRVGHPGNCSETRTKKKLEIHIFFIHQRINVSEKATTIPS